MVAIETEVYVQSVDNVTDGSLHAVKIQVLIGGIVVWNKDIMYTINTTILVRKLSSNIAMILLNLILISFHFATLPQFCYV